MVGPIGGGTGPSTPEPLPETSGPYASTSTAGSESSIFLSDDISNPFLASILESDTEFDYSIKGYMGLLQEIRILFDDLDENEFLVDLTISGSLIDQILEEIKGLFGSFFGSTELQDINREEVIAEATASYKNNRIYYAEADGIKNFVDTFIVKYNEDNGTSIDLLPELNFFPSTPANGDISAQETLDILNYNETIEEINTAMTTPPLDTEFPTFNPLEKIPFNTNLGDTITLVDFYNSDKSTLDTRIDDYNTLAQEYNDALDQYNADYTAWQVDHAQWQTVHTQWQSDYSDWQADYQIWVLTGMIGPQPIEPEEPIEPAEPASPADYYQWLQDHAQWEIDHALWVINHQAWVNSGVGPEPVEPVEPEEPVPSYSFTTLPEFPNPPTTAVLNDGYPIIPKPLPSITAPPSELTLATRDDIITYNDNYAAVNSYFQDISDHKDALNFLFEDVYGDTFDNNELIEGIITDYPTNNLSDVQSIIDYYNFDEVLRINEWLADVASRLDLNEDARFPEPPGDEMDQSLFDGADLTPLPVLPELSSPPTTQEITDYNNTVATINARMTEPHIASAYPTTVADPEEHRYYWKPLPAYTTSSEDFTALQTQHDVYTQGYVNMFGIDFQGGSIYQYTEQLAFEPEFIDFGPPLPSGIGLTYVNNSVYELNALFADGNLGTYDRFKLLPNVDYDIAFGNPFFWYGELGIYDDFIDTFMAPIEEMVSEVFGDLDSALAEERAEQFGIFSILRNRRFQQTGSIDNILNNDKPIHMVAEDFIGGAAGSTEDLDIPSIFNFNRETSPNLLTLTTGEQNQKSFNPEIVNLFIDPSFRAGFAGLIRNAGLAGGIKGLQVFKEQELLIKESVKTTVFGQVTNPVTPDFESAAGIGLALSYLEAVNAKNVEKLASQLFSTLPIEVQDQIQGQLRTDMLEDIGILLQSTFLNLAVRTLNLYSPDALNSITLTGGEFNAKQLVALTANRSQLLGSVISFLAANGTNLDGASSGGIPPYGNPLSLSTDQLELLFELLSGERDDLKALTDSLTSQQVQELNTFFNLENSIIQTSIDSLRIENEQRLRDIIKEEVIKREISIEAYGLSLPEPGTSLIAFTLKEEALKQLGNNILDEGPLLAKLTADDIIALETNLREAGLLGDNGTIQEAISDNRSLILQSIQNQSPSDRIRDELAGSVLGFGSFINLRLSQEDSLTLAKNILQGNVGLEILSGLSEVGKNRLAEISEELMTNEELDRERTGIPNAHDLLTVAFSEIVNEVGVDYAEKIIDDARSTHRRDDKMTIFLRALLDPGIVFIKEFSMQTSTKSFLTQDANAIRT